MKHMNKKPIIYACILAGILLTTLVISFFTGVDTSNTWLGLFFVNTFFLTIVIMFFDLAKTAKTSRALTGYLIYFMSSIIILFIIIGNIAFFVDILGN